MLSILSNIWERFAGVSDKVNSNRIVRVIQRALTALIPVLMIGAFSLIVRSFPIPSYQTFLKTGFGKFIFDTASVVYNSTFGLLSVYMSVSIGYCMATRKSQDSFYIFGMILSSIISFSVTVGAFTADFNPAYCGVNGMFMGIAAPLISTVIYAHVDEKGKLKPREYSSETTNSFNSAIASISPLLAVLLVFTVIQLVSAKIFGTSCLQKIFAEGIHSVFEQINNRFLQGFFFILLSSLLWFFGIHGSDVLNSINEGIFTDYINENIKTFSAGGTPQYIVSKTFIDVFVLMGGCGTALCLLVAILLFCKRKANRRLGITAGFPMLFNINEIMVFGLPIIYNPMLFIPFIITPLVLFLTSYMAIFTGLVPVPHVAVEWTTPIFLSGYTATGSFSAVILQAVNLVIGVLIYMPFIKRHEKSQINIYKNEMNELIRTFKKSEEDGTEFKIRKLPANLNMTAKALMFDLEAAIRNEKLEMYYQPQFDENKKFIGAEALLRWKHDIFGLVYPPLVIKIAEEAKLLDTLEKYVIERSVTGAARIGALQNKNIHISVNLTAKTLQESDIEEFLQQLSESKNFRTGMICIEVTEQAALEFSEKTKELFNSLHEMGYLLAIDDFSMGHTSVRYLQDNKFDIVKLDGSLVKSLKNNERSLDIVKSIVYLSQSLNFAVLAEYVETDEEMNSLLGVGCNLFQGWLYSKALPFEKFKAFTDNHELTDRNVLEKRNEALKK